jgi:hypothetical protein
MAISGLILEKFLDKYPFSSTKVISRHFRISPPTVKEILRREPGLKKVSRRSIEHLLSDDQQKLWIDASQKLLSMLEMHLEHYFEGIGPANESRFQ